MKKSRNRVFTPYLARARARAPGPLPQVGSWASGPLPQGGVIGNPQGGRACGFPQVILRTSRFKFYAKTRKC